MIVSFFKAYPLEGGSGSVAYNVAKHLSGTRYLVQLSNESCPQSNGRYFTLNKYCWTSRKQSYKGILAYKQISNSFSKDQEAAALRTDNGGRFLVSLLFDTVLWYEEIAPTC